MMNRTIASAAVVLLALGGCRSADVESGPAAGPSPSIQPAPPPATAGALPSGTMLEIELQQTIGTDMNQVGDRFVATVKDPIVAQNGAVAVPAGAQVHGVITGLDDSDHPGDRALIRLNFERITFNGESRPLTANVVDTDVDLDGDGLEDVAEDAGVGAAAGAALGAVLGGLELDEILGGAALGAGAGTVISLGAGDVEARLPQGTDMTIQVTQRVSL